MGDLKSVSANVQVQSKKESVLLGKGWTIIRNFENAPLDAVDAHDVPPYPYGFSSGARWTFYDTYKLLSGSNRNVRCEFYKDKVEAASKLGGRIPFKNFVKDQDASVRNGQSVWVRAYFRFEPDFIVDCPNNIGGNGCSAGIKFIRIMTEGSGVDDMKNEGSHDVKMMESLLGDNRIGLYVDSEVSGSGHKDRYPSEKSFNQLTYKFKNKGGTWDRPLGYLEKDKWQYVEFMVRNDYVQNRNALFILWINGKYAFHTSQPHSARFDFSYYWAVYFFTQWNGGIPHDQECYMDDIEITTKKPSKFDPDDPNKFPMIGPR